MVPKFLNPSKVYLERQEAELEAGREVLLSGIRVSGWHTELVHSRTALVYNTKTEIVVL